MLKREQIEAIVRFAALPRPQLLHAVEAEAARIGIAAGTLRVHVSNYRHGRVPASWRRILGEPE